MPVRGPVEVGCASEFLAWLTDPEQAGGGAMIDFGCYGVNLMTRIKGGQAPQSVTAFAHRWKPDVYPRVEDDATIILAYPDAQATIHASWGWPTGRKDMEVYGTIGYVVAPDPMTIRTGRTRTAPEQVVQPHPRRLATASTTSPRWCAASCACRPTPTYSGLANNLVVMDVLDAARQSARRGVTISLGA